MTSPTPLPPHQDPVQNDDPSRVTMIEYVTTLIAQLDRRFDTLHADLKDSITQRFTDSDLRYQQRFDAQTKALDAALAAQKEAVLTAMVAAERATTKAETAADKRFESVNEFRQSLTDQTATFMPRTEAVSRMDSLAEKIDDLKSRVGAFQGRSAGLNAGWVYLLGAVAAGSTLISIILMIISRT